MDVVTNIITYGLSPGFIPDWKKLPRSVKTKLLVRLGEKKYCNIHDPRFYQELERRWKEDKQSLMLYFEVGAKQTRKFDCSICYETYTFDDKTTTLMCGHKFCTRCIMTNIHRCGYGSTCPLCRRKVFELEAPDLTDVERLSEEEIALERKRVKRRLERKTKRERKRGHRCLLTKVARDGWIQQQMQRAAGNSRQQRASVGNSRQQSDVFIVTGLSNDAWRQDFTTRLN